MGNFERIGLGAKTEQAEIALGSLILLIGVNGPRARRRGLLAADHQLSPRRVELLLAHAGEVDGPPLSRREEDGHGPPGNCHELVD